MLGVLLLVYGALLHFSIFLPGGAEWSPTAPGVLSRLIYGWVGTQGRLPDILALILLFFQGFAINVVIAENRLAGEVNLFPGVFYLLTASVLPEFTHLTPVLLGNTFFLLALMQFFRIYQVPDCASRIFNGGLLIGLAGLCYMAFFYFFLFGTVVLYSLRAFRIKEWLMVLSGVLLPLLWALVIAFLRDDLPGLFQHWVSEWAFWQFAPAPDAHLYMGLGWYGLLLLVVLFSRDRYLFKTIFQVQKKINLLYWALLAGGVSLLTQNRAGLDHLLVLALPLAILISLNFTAMPRRTAEVLHFMMLVAVIVFHYLSLTGLV